MDIYRIKQISFCSDMKTFLPCVVTCNLVLHKQRCLSVDHSKLVLETLCINCICAAFLLQFHRSIPLRTRIALRNIVKEFRQNSAPITAGSWGNIAHR